MIISTLINGLIEVIEYELAKNQPEIDKIIHQEIELLISKLETYIKKV